MPPRPVSISFSFGGSPASPVPPPSPEVTVPAGTFEDCIKTKDENPLDGATENKFYCPGAGFVREEFEEGDLNLVSH